jgi:BirA family biotin operon repressor/biotin-[acetyl-CoA-carboxylase] ligase
VIDAARVEDRTGWPVVALGVVASTNDEAARRAGAAGGRLAVVADRQTAGRGRGGASFASPGGGLYVSLAMRARVEEVPAPLVAALGVAVADAVERVAGKPARLKWPNDVWLEGRKVAGILVEAAMPARGGARDAGSGPADEVDVVAGIGVNVARVPEGLPEDVSAGTTALDLHAGSPVDREALLVEVLRLVDATLADLRAPGGLGRLDAAYRSRAALLGRHVRFQSGASEVAGVLADVSVERGLSVEDGAGGRRWHAMAHVRSLRADPSVVPRPPVIPS